MTSEPLPSAAGSLNVREPCNPNPTTVLKLEKEREREREREMETENESPSIVIPEDWSRAADTITYGTTSSPPPVVVICGAKNAGKTTFSRHLVNTLQSRFSKLAYLDTDVGQTEFTPPGFLSLTLINKIAPDLTTQCLRTPQRSIFYGDVSSKTDPKRYLKCVSVLYNYYTEEYCLLNKSESSGKGEVPLVVNTPGWVKGIGYEILVEMISYIDPSHVVKISISMKGKNLPNGLFWLHGVNYGMQTLIEIDSPHWSSSAAVYKEASLMRDQRLMTYFKQCIPNNSNISTIRELAHALASYPPYEVFISKIKIKHLFCHVPSSEIFHSLNATIVGLAINSEDFDTPQCVGLGIVRGIDLLRQLLYMITPVPHGTLEKVDLLLQGFIQIPTCLLQVRGGLSPYVAANVVSTC